jgi:hypothetical protein
MRSEPPAPQEAGGFASQTEDKAVITLCHSVRTAALFREKQSPMLQRMSKTPARRPRVRRSILIVSPRPVRRPSPRITRRDLTPRTPTPRQAANAETFAPDPYLDYSRHLTTEGGVALIYKDIDERWRFVVRRLCLWGIATGAAAWLLLHQSPVRNLAVNIAAIIVIAVINWLIVRQPIEVYRSIEIRAECMILDGHDTFWLRHMESWPAFGPGEDGTQVLSGIYGTRQVEYLKVRCFDEFDSTPMVMAAHLQEAMQQLWSWPY